MYFKISDDIRRETNFKIEDIRRLDEYLASPNRKRFDLFSVESHTELGNCTEPLLDEYIKRGAVSDPSFTYLCPVHDSALKSANSGHGHCIDCGTTYELESCDKEVVYERIRVPEKLPVPARTTQIVHSTKTHQPTVRQRLLESFGQHTVFIIRGVIVGVIVALLAAWLIPSVFPPSTNGATPTSPISTASPTDSNQSSHAVTVSAESRLLQDSTSTLAFAITPRVTSDASQLPSPTS